MATRLVITRFPFNGMPKGFTFTYDTETDERIGKLILAGYLSDITERLSPSPLSVEVDLVGPPTQIIEMPSIESAEEIGDINGPGADQPFDGGGGGSEVDDAAGTEGMQGDEGAGAKVAKGRKLRTDLPADG
jgi:hypothetical protein